MNIGGFQKNSLIDFPETISCVIFTRGCNFLCPYCHNPDLVAGAFPGAGRSYDETEILYFLENRKGFLDGVVITGGEPTLQPDLAGFCRKIKDLGFKIKLDTNGTAPDDLDRLLDAGLLDYIAMDIKTSLDLYHLVAPRNINLRRIEKSISLIMEKAPAYEFRTTCLKPFVSEDNIMKIAGMIKDAALYILQPCSGNVPVLDPESIADDHNFFSKKQMAALRLLIAPHVKNCRIR